MGIGSREPVLYGDCGSKLSSDQYHTDQPVFRERKTSHMFDKSLTGRYIKEKRCRKSGKLSSINGDLDKSVEFAIAVSGRTKIPRSSQPL